MPLGFWGAVKQYVFRPLGSVLGGMFVTEAVFHVGEAIAGEMGVPPVAVDSMKAACSTIVALTIMHVSGNRSVTPAGAAIKTLVPGAVAIGTGIGGKFIAKSLSFPESTSWTDDQKELADGGITTGTAALIGTGLYALSSLYIDKKFKNPEDEDSIEVLPINGAFYDYKDEKQPLLPEESDVSIPTYTK